MRINNRINALRCGQWGASIPQYYKKWEDKQYGYSVDPPEDEVTVPAGHRCGFVGEREGGFCARVCRYVSVHRDVLVLGDRLC